MPVILPRTFVICSSLLNTTSLLFLLSATRQFSSSSEARPEGRIFNFDINTMMNHMNAQMTNNIWDRH